MRSEIADLVKNLEEVRSWLRRHPLRDAGLEQSLGENWEKDLAFAVDKVRRYRSTALNGERGPTTSDSLSDGRPLILLPKFNLMDGAAWSASGGFFDELNFPPPATWVTFKESLRIESTGRDEAALVSWVPKTHEAHAQRGIDANPEECLAWMEDLAPSLCARILLGQDR